MSNTGNKDNDTVVTKPDFADIRAAGKRIENHIESTPVLHELALDAELGCEVWLKCENLQKTGSFKLRGASNAIACLAERGILSDVATHSSGNHGAALALAAHKNGRTAHVVMPANSVKGKIDAVRNFGGQVVICEPGQANREYGLAELVAAGLEPIPPYDHPDIIAGQGTAAMELIDFMGDIDVLVTPLGGGGLLAGSAIASHYLRPETEIIGAEPAGAADALASLRAGERVTQWDPETIADGLRAVIGELNFAIIQELVDDILIADDQDIEKAMKLIMKMTGMIIEPSSAVAIAIIMKHPRRFAGKRTGIIITGGNYDPGLFPWVQES